jgi:cytochrome P450
VFELLTTGTLLPQLRNELARAVQDAEDRHDGLASIDLVTTARLAFLQMACALTGIDLDGRDTLTRLVQLLDPLNSGDALRWAASPEEERRVGLDALDEFKSDYFEPSLQRRQHVLNNERLPESASTALPVDMMSLIASGADPAWQDEGNALRNVVQLLLGASHTNVHPLGHALAELSVWFEQNPDAADRRTDTTFLADALNEVMRLHPIGPFLWRIATEELVLESGIHIRQGARVAIDINAANHDPAVYGAEAERFDPRRMETIKGNKFGLAFGAGAHMCPGVPFVLGATGTDGGVVEALQLLLAVGAQPDPERTPARSQGYRDTYLRYPVVVTRDRVQGTP